MSITADLVNLNDLSKTERQALTKETYAHDSYFQSVFHQDQTELACAEQSQAFRDQIQRLLLERCIISDESIQLESLHEHLSEEMKTYGFDDGVNKISTYFYETDEAFLQVYYQFIRHLRENYFKEPFWFQATPTIRIHAPNGINVHHYPRYHTDIGYGHPQEETNLWLPLTELLDGHSFRTMSVANSKTVLENFDYDFPSFIDSAIKDKAFTSYCNELSNPVTTEFGNVLAFDSRCVHTGEPMKTHTRASMDIRVLPRSQYDKMKIQYQGAGRRKIIFAPGQCYHAQDSDHI